MERLILASGSKARRKLLEELGVVFEAIAADVDEDNHPEKDPPRRVADLARMKAQKIHAENPGAWVIGGDSVIVAQDGTLLEKPRDIAHAEEMLRRQSGTWSTDYASLCVIRPDGEIFEDVASGKVLFDDLSEETIRWWLDAGFWKGNSGGFVIEGPGQLILPKIDGNMTSVMGFPIWLLGRLFEKAGTPIQSFMNR